MRTPMSKRIKGVFISGTKETLAGGADLRGDNWGSHLFDEDVTIIGCILGATWDGIPPMDSGEYDGGFHLSKEANYATQIMFNTIRIHVTASEVLVAAAKTQVALGPKTTQQLIMFPEGYGIDVDDGGSIYITGYVANSMSDPVDVFPWALLLVVER